MYRSAVTAVFLSALALMAADGAIRLLKHGPAADRHPSPSAALRWLRLLVNIAGLLSLLLVAATGFYAIFTGQGMEGDRLMWHVTTAGMFAPAAVAVALFWAEKNRFAAGDAGRLFASGGWGATLRKVFFWMAMALAVPTLVSILAAMFPLFGTDDQQQLFRIHRYCAPLLAATATLFAYFALVTRRERSRD